MAKVQCYLVVVHSTKERDGQVEASAVYSVNQARTIAALKLQDSDIDQYSVVWIEKDRLRLVCTTCDMFTSIDDKWVRSTLVSPSVILAAAQKLHDELKAHAEYEREQDAMAAASV